MATYGEVRFRLSKLAGAAGVDIDLLDGWIEGRHREILDALPWQRLDAQGALQSVAEYNTGTLTATAGSDAITGDGTTWTSAMTGRIIRVNGGEEYYEFTYVGETTGTLDRDYEGESGSALTYQINKNIYQLPADLRILHQVTSAVSGGPLKLITLKELNDSFTRRTTYGTPAYYAVYMDYPSDPPVSQVELYPVPDEAAMFTYNYTYDPDTPSETSTSFRQWVRPSCLIAGVQADMAATAAEAVRHEARFGQLLRQMVAIGAARKGATPMRMAAAHTRHRRRRWLR